jgi:anaerobic magnesium-protoporphyrin IX monomethyl ester cyclase
MRLLLVEISPADQRDARLTNGLGYIAAYVRQQLPEIEIRIIKGDPAWISRAVEEYQPDMVGLSTVSQYYAIAVEAAEICQRGGAFVVVGGHHLSALPGSMTLDMDLGVIGEGEDVMLDICRTYLDRGPVPEAFAAIPGVTLRDEKGQLATTEPRPVHRPLDDFPFPARDLMHIRPGASVGVITSRGCPYRCVFCVSSAFWGKIRYHSPEYVVAEIKEIVGHYQSTHIYFWDDLFVANLKRVREIATLLRREPMLHELKYSLTCRANLATDELARLLKDMNVVEVMLGLESMAPRTLQYLKPHVTVEENREAVETLHRHGLNVTGFFVIGSPQETREEIRQTLEYVRAAPLYRAEAYLLTPLPGTQVWDHAVEHGLLDPDNVPWERLYIDNPEDPTNGIHLAQTLSEDELRGYWREFQRIRRRKDRRNLLRRVPQHLSLLLRSPGAELGIIAERLKTRRYGHI